MGIPVLILGESGSGKSTSLRNFQKDSKYTGQYIYQTLIYHLREQLLKGVF